MADASRVTITWLSAGTTSGPANTTTTVSVSVTANTGGTARTGYIHLKAGRLTKIITVDQNG
ncbi:BACON domain-containing protein [Dysgonomonas reticulitermitis]